MTHTKLLFLGLLLAVTSVGADALAQSDDDPGGEGQGSPDAALAAGKRLFKEAEQRIVASCPAADPKTGQVRPGTAITAFDIKVSHNTGNAHVVGITDAPSASAARCATGIFNAVKVPPWKGKDVTFSYSLKFSGADKGDKKK